MTKPAKLLISDLLKGFYLLPWKRPSGAKCYRLYDTKGQPVKNIRDRTFSKIDRLIDPKIKIFKTDKKTGKITLSRSDVIKLRKNHGIKVLYKQTISKKNDTTQQVPEPTTGQIQIQFTRHL